MRNSFKQRVLVGLALVGGSVSANAAIIGQLNISGNVVVMGTAAQINFQRYASPPGNGTETFVINNSTGSFATPIAGSDGFGTEITPLSAPINTTVSIPNFLTFTGVPYLSFTLTQVVGGVFGTAQCSANPAVAATGQQCSPAGTPFNLTNTSSNTTDANFQVLGLFVDSRDGTSTPYKGTFTASYVNGPYQTLLATAQNGGSTLISYGAQFIPTNVPEPSMGMLTALLGAGLVGVGALRRKK